MFRIEYMLLALLTFVCYYVNALKHMHQNMHTQHTHIHTYSYVQTMKYNCNVHTCTTDSNIIIMTTTCGDITPSISVCTVKYGLFISIALNIIQPNSTTRWSRPWIIKILKIQVKIFTDNCGCRTLKFPLHTVPHSPLYFISSLPLYDASPSLKRTF